MWIFFVQVVRKSVWSPSACCRWKDANQFLWTRLVVLCDTTAARRLRASRRRKFAIGRQPISISCACPNVCKEIAAAQSATVSMWRGRKWSRTLISLAISASAFEARDVVLPRNAHQLWRTAFPWCQRANAALPATTVAAKGTIADRRIQGSLICSPCCLARMRLIRMEIWSQCNIHMTGIPKSPIWSWTKIPSKL